MKILQRHTDSQESFHHHLERYKRKMKVFSSGKMHIISKERILYLKSDSNYCEIYMLDGSKYLCSQTLKSLSSKLPATIFFRTHQSFVINIQQLQSIDNAMSELTISGDIVVPISRSRRSELREKLEVWFD